MIREGTPADRAQLRAIQEAALDEPWPDLLETALDGPPLVLVLAEPDPVAYALAVVDDDVAYLAEFAVSPAAQDAGYGSRLMTATLDRLAEEGTERVRLTTRADDERVRAFYADHGFTVLERLPGHYDDGDGLLLVRELDERGD